MAITPVPAMSPTPPFPALSDRADGTYNSKAFEFGTHMASKFNGELAAVATSAFNNATEAEARATDAAAAATATADDRAQTAADRIQTGEDVIAAGQEVARATAEVARAAAEADRAQAAAGQIGTTAAFSDANPVVKGSADPTKLMRFEVDGLTTGTTRVLTVPNRDGAIVLEGRGANIASAPTINLDTATGDLVHITGTTTITAITLASGASRDVVFDGILTLTHDATTLMLPGAASITTAAGDRATFRGDGVGNVRCMQYTRASGGAVSLGSYPAIQVQDRRAAGVAGGTILSTRTLNTVLKNTIPGASLASDRVSLPPGTYRVRGYASATSAGVHKASIYSVTSAAHVALGSTSYAPSSAGSDSTFSLIDEEFTLAAASVVELRHVTSLPGSGGQPANGGTAEVYCNLLFEKIL